MAVDHSVLCTRAVNDANQLVIDFGAFGDAEMIGNLAKLVEQGRYPDAPRLRAMVAVELRVWAAVIASMTAGSPGGAR